MGNEEKTADLNFSVKQVLFIFIFILKCHDPFLVYHTISFEIKCNGIDKCIGLVEVLVEKVI